MAALLTIITSFLVSLGTVVLRENFSAKRDAKTREEAKKNHLLLKLESLADSLSMLPSALEELHIERIKSLNNGVPSQESMNAILARCNSLVVLYFNDQLSNLWNPVAEYCNIACLKSIEFMIANLQLAKNNKPLLMPGSQEGEAFKLAKSNCLSAFENMLKEMPSIRIKIDSRQQ